MKKAHYKILLGLVLVAAFFLITSLIHIWYMESHPMVTPFKYTPNGLTYKKPGYTQLIRTDEDVQRVKAAPIRDAQFAEKGAVIKLGEIGLSVIPKEEAQSPEYHFKWVGVQKALVKEIAGFRFEPNTLFTQDPIRLQVIHKESEVQAASTQKWLNNKNLLEVGAAIHCPQKGACFTMAKSTLKKEYRKVVPIATAKVPAK